MSVLWSIIGGLVLLLVALFGYVGFFVRKLGTPTKGELINLTERPSKALLIIDVQEDFTRNTGKHSFDPQVRDAALKVMNQEIAEARSHGSKVVFVKNIFRDWPVIQMMKLVAGGIGTPGREGLKFDRDIVVGDAPVFEKSVGDTFSNPDFETWLAEKKIGRLTLVGLDACHCVQLTAKGARSRGYDVEIREPATLTATPAKWPSLKSELDAAGVVVC
ncbi:isochorismatase family protein [Labrenzia sp. DG1229]|uniref:cysteine hydrolase family protein n=1 Tax=Labrenzia sp. DG1229 TaxID=681847 RepID=UPI000491A607|nr:isochorismatase family protein [Labrenzia sp. DG1229]